MEYISTRGNKSTTFSFETALTSGYAPDGGLFVPKELPKLITPLKLQDWSKLGYPSLAAECLRLFISEEEIPFPDLKELCHMSFRPAAAKEEDNGGGSYFDIGGFDDPENAVVVKAIGNKQISKDSIFISELFHGPTFCFKDLGMKFVVNALSYFCTKRKQKMTLLVSTTGDTGPAAVQSVSEIQNDNSYLSILVHYPKGQISDFQRKQLTFIDSKNIKVATFEGGGDDMDTPIKNMLTAKTDYKKECLRDRKLCGVNSYNIGRPLMQMVHYVWTYLRVVEQIGVVPGSHDVKVDIVMPTGAMGNITGGFIAKLIGVPLGFLCSGVNVNDITHRVIQTGKFHKSDAMEKTLSDAINIQVPYNFERLLFYISNEDSTLIQKWMKTMDSTNKLDLEQECLKELQSVFQSARITDDEMCEAMKTIYNKFGYLADPHTSVAIAAAKKLGYDIYEEMKYFSTKNPMAILSTASPCKFEESVTAAIGEDAWKRYFVSDHFPLRAKALIEKEEIPPILYPWQNDKTLDETQKEWERMAIDIITTNFI